MCVLRNFILCQQKKTALPRMFSTLRSVVGADNESTGAALMKKVMEDLDGKGNIVELLGPMGSDGQEQFPRELRIRVRFLQTFALI